MNPGTDKEEIKKYIFKLAKLGKYILNKSEDKTMYIKKMKSDEVITVIKNNFLINLILSYDPFVEIYVFIRRLATIDTMKMKLIIWNIKFNLPKSDKLKINPPIRIKKKGNKLKQR